MLKCDVLFHYTYIMNTRLYTLICPPFPIIRGKKFDDTCKDALNPPENSSTTCWNNQISVLKVWIFMPKQWNFYAETKFVHKICAGETKKITGENIIFFMM